MSKLRNVATTTLRWSWFGLLVLLAFGYLVGGLSGNRQSKLTSSSNVRTNVSYVVDSDPMSAVERMEESLRSSVQEIDDERKQ